MIEPTEHLQRIGVLLLALAGLKEDSTRTHDLLLELVRCELWYRLQDHDRWFEVAHRVIWEVLPTLTDDPDWTDSRLLIESAAGMSMELFWAITTTMAVRVSNEPNTHLFPAFTDTSHVPNPTMDQWTALWTIPLDEARAAAARDLTDRDLWTFSAFYDRPLVRVNSSRALLSRPWFLAIKATPTGYFNLVEQLLLITSGDTLRWSRLFGKAVERLGRMLVEEHVGSIERLDEIAVQKRWGPGKACDTVLLGDSWLAVDFVHRRISKATATSGGIDDLAKDLAAGVIKKLKQIDQTLDRGIAQEGAPPKGMYPLVVVGAPFPVNGLVMGEIYRRLDVEKPQVIGVNSGCRPPLLMDLGEFWMLLETAEEHSVTPQAFLAEWLASPVRTTSFRNWLVTHGPGQPGLKEPRRYATHARRYMFGSS